MPLKVVDPAASEPIISTSGTISLGTCEGDTAAVGTEGLVAKAGGDAAVGLADAVDAEVVGTAAASIQKHTSESQLECLWPRSVTFAVFAVSMSARRAPMASEDTMEPTDCVTTTLTLMR